jgi:hypothetical protein
MTLLDSDDTTNDTPMSSEQEHFGRLVGNWERGVGEAHRPLTNDGYYDKWFYRPLPGSNQFTEYYLVLNIDTANMPPTEHVMLLDYCSEDDTEITCHERLEYDSVQVAYPNDDGSQTDAEHRISQRAVNTMQQYKDWEPPFLR